MIKNLWFPALAGLLAVLGVAGCSDWNDSHGKGDAPVGKRHEAPRELYEMPDGFANLAVVCIGPDLVISTTREAPPVVSQNDKNCEG